jgi:hypothetical protein
MYIRKVKSNFDKTILVYNRWFMLAFYPCYEGRNCVELRCQRFILRRQPNEPMRLIPYSLIAKECYLKFYPTNKKIYITYFDGTTSY